MVELPAATAQQTVPLTPRPTVSRLAPSRIMLHDFAGHAFQVQLSRCLAARGHQVRHLYCADNPTPKGALSSQPGDAQSFSVAGLATGGAYDRHKFSRRWWYEASYGRHLAAAIADWRPEVFVCTNTPLESLLRAVRVCRRLSVPVVFWVQDMNGLAAWRILSESSPILGNIIGRHYLRMERRIARGASALIAISPDFADLLDEWAGSSGATTVIENWAPIEDIPVRPRDNPWARAHGLTGKTTFMYTGMMGMKHNAGLLLTLARRFQHRDDVAVVVVSQGLGADKLRAGAAEHGLANLKVLDFQPYQQLPDVLGAADVFVATLEAKAGSFAVPSKVLSYFCAGRPILAAMPAQNLAAKRIAASGAGIVVPPDDPRAFVAAADALAGDPQRCAAMAANARAHAQRTFRIDDIAERFEHAFASAVVATRGMPAAKSSNTKGGLGVRET